MKKTVQIAAAVAAGVAVGAILGVLFAKGGGVCGTRKGLCSRGKKLEGMVDAHLDDDTASLEAVRDALQHQLRRVNKRLQGS